MLSGNEVVTPTRQPALIAFQNALAPALLSQWHSRGTQSRLKYREVATWHRVSGRHQMARASPSVLRASLSQALATFRICGMGEWSLAKLPLSSALV